jgi:hypothetical protein
VKIIRIDSLMPDGRGGHYHTTHYWRDQKWLVCSRGNATVFSCKRELDFCLHWLISKGREPGSLTVEEL